MMGQRGLDIKIKPKFIFPNRRLSVRCPVRGDVTMVPRALFALTVLGVLGKADDQVTRSKRFFNLHSYFKSTSDSSADGATTAPTRNVKILGSGSSCVGDSNCSLVTVAKFESNVNAAAATPASYLTPPSAWPERNGGSYYPPTADQYQTNQNGYYEYSAAAAKNATLFPTGYEEGEHRSGYYYGPSTTRAQPMDTQPLNVKLKSKLKPLKAFKSQYVSPANEELLRGKYRR